MIRRFAVWALHSVAVRAYHLCVVCSIAARKLQPAPSVRASVIQPIRPLVEFTAPRHTFISKGSEARN